MQKARIRSRRLRTVCAFAAAVCGGMIAPFSVAHAQQRIIRVLGDDGEPVAFANVTLAGERPQITNEKGEVAVGAAARQAVKIDVRRLGYEPWYGTAALGDTVMSVQVTLHRISRRMFTVKVIDSSRVAPSFLRGFYERMLARQRGIGNGIYLTPEEVDKRNAGMVSALLQGINGVSLRRMPSGKLAAMNSGGSCQMTVLVDGHAVCPEGGCNGGAGPPPPPPSSSLRRSNRTTNMRAASGDDQGVAIDDVVNENEIAAVEVYPRGASVPPSLPTADASCGLVALWTGGRRAP
jgi:hypothetical protein